MYRSGLVVCMYHWNPIQYRKPSTDTLQIPPRIVLQDALPKIKKIQQVDVIVSLMYPSYPPQLTAEQLQYLLTSTKDWSIAHGLAVRPQTTFVDTKHDPTGVLATTAPVTLFPSLFPRSCFEKGQEIQTAYNRLYSAIARDEVWLKGIVEELVDIDDFLSKLWDVHRSVKREGYVQPLTLGLFRSDYMVHVNSTSENSLVELKQVEFNTIASSFGGLSSKVAELHKHLLLTNAYPLRDSEKIPTPSSLAPSNAARSLAHGLAAAHKSYGSSTTNNRPLCVLIIVQDPERNVFDQRHLEYYLHEQDDIMSFRVPFSKVLDCTRLDDQKSLLYNPPHAPTSQWEVTTVYYRAGYSPDDYPSPKEWEARLHLERSRAIKCPSILTHLAGCKKVQQVLATPNSPHLTKFSPKDAASLLKTFAPIYPLDTTTAGLEARKLALDPDSASHYVLKPQREGGGNNVYRRAIPEFLKNLPKSHWPAYILMEMIEPPAQSNIIIRNGEVQKGGVICELGVYGVCLWEHPTKEGEEGRILENWEAGYLLRTKGDQSEEGGVAAGFGAVDSCCLIEK